MKKAVILMLLALPFNTVAGELEELIATVINLNGFLCADIKTAHRLRNGHLYEVKCVKYRQGSATQVYLVNMESMVAWKD